MVQAVILEDRSSHRDELLSRLAAWPRADRLELRCAATAEELRCLLQAAPADILLADIDLGEGEGTGIQLVRELNTALQGRGGGKPGFVQGSLAASRTDIEAFFTAESCSMPDPA